MIVQILFVVMACVILGWGFVYMLLNPTEAPVMTAKLVTALTPAREERALIQEVPVLLVVFARNHLVPV
jgi:hypothetical protein